LLEFLQSVFELEGRRNRPREPSQAGGTHRSPDHRRPKKKASSKKGDRELIQLVVAFGDKTVRELMTPRPRIVAIRQDATLEELRQLVINEQFSRIPVYEDGHRSDRAASCTCAICSN
jgi:CBS domain containing-hemolysin-like protein